MAEDESLLEIDDEKILNNIVKLQAQIRGTLIRKAFHDIQKHYEEIVAEIEEDMFVQWPSKIVGRPVLKKRRNEKCHDLPQDKSKKQGGHAISINAGEHNDFSDANDENKINHNPSSLHTDLHQPVSNNDATPCLEVNNRLSAHERAENSLSYHLPHSINVLNTPSSQGLIQNSTNLPMAKDCVSIEVQTDEIKEFVCPENNSIEIEGTNKKYLMKQISSQPKTVLKTKPSWQSSENSNSMCERMTPVDKTGISEINSFEGKTHESFSAFLNNSSSANGIEEIKIEDDLLSKSDKIINSNDKSEVVMDFEGPQDQSENLSENDKTDATKSCVEEKNAFQGDGVLLDLPKDKTELLKLRSTTAMELLWIEQAINSRKNYLRLRQQMA